MNETYLRKIKTIEGSENGYEFKDIPLLWHLLFTAISY